MCLLSLSLALTSLLDTRTHRAEHCPRPCGLWSCDQVDDDEGGGVAAAMEQLGGASLEKGRLGDGSAYVLARLAQSKLAIAPRSNDNQASLTRR